MSKLRIKRKMDGYLYNIYNTISKISFHISPYKNLVKENIKFKNIHKGKRCFILGTGPSLRDVNCDYLKNEITFGVNFLYKGDVIKYIIPKYYCLYDPIFYTSHISYTKELVERFPETIFFMNSKAYKYIVKNNIDSRNIYYHHFGIFQHEELIIVDMIKNMTAPFNVVLGCIQSALYMGFKEIYLLGCDYNSFATPKIQHYYDNVNGSNRTRSLAEELEEYSMVSKHHYALDKYSKKNNVIIYNITPNSLLDAYDRKELGDIFING